MELDLMQFTNGTWEGAESVDRAKANLIEEQIALGNMMRLEDGRVVITLAGCNAYQAELDAEYNATYTASNNERLLNSLVAFPRNRN